MWSAVGNSHLTSPVSGSSAYRMPSNEPMYTVPSEPIAGEEVTNPTVSRFHSSSPAGSSAWMKRSSEPKYSFPSSPIPTADQTEFSVGNSHRSDPSGLSA